MKTNILGLSTARPVGTLSQEQALSMAAGRCDLTPRRAALLKRFYTHSTVRQRASVLADADPSDGSAAGLDRYYALPSSGNGHGPTVSQRMRRYDREALPLAARAARQAIASAGIPPGDVAQVVAVSCTGLSSPGLDIGLIRELDLPTTTGRTVIGFMGCHGAINGLRVASGLACETPGTCVLLCAVELCTLHFQYGWDEGKVIANGLFADGAAAAVLRAGGDTEQPRRPWRLRATGSCLLPDSSGDMGWRIGDHGFEMTLSNRVTSLIGGHLRPWLNAWLSKHGRSVDEVGSWAIHPGGPKVIDAVQEALRLSGDATEPSRDVLAEHGNMSSPTVLFILRQLADRGADRPCVMLAFGPGLVVEAALLE